MKKNYSLKLFLTLLTVFVSVILSSCTTKKDGVAYYQRIDQTNQYDIRLTYYYTGDTVTKQNTENYISYKSLGITEGKENAEDQKKAAQAKVTALSHEYQKVKGVKEKLVFDEKGIKETVEIDYGKANIEELSKLPGMGMSSGKNTKRISMKLSGDMLEKNGYKKIENGKFEELKK